MSSLKQDLEFLQSIFDPFFRQNHVKKTLASIKEDSITGWEKWLQIEISSFLRQHEKVKRWVRESPYALDQRVAQSRTKCAVDFIIHQKHKHSHLALEVKQVNSPASCINAMTKDVKKMISIRGSEFDIRSVWCLGVHNNETLETIHREINYYSNKHNVEIDTNLTYTAKIGLSGFSYTLL